MAGLKPITVNTPPEADPHIYAEDDAAIYQSIFGSDGVMTIGQKCASQVISNNKVRVKDGVLVAGGHIARIPYGEYIDCEIANGQSGKNRNDIIIAKFVTTGSGGIDTYTCEVKQGGAGTSASDPALTQNDIYAGGKIREVPLYRVKLEGLSIVAVEQLFKLVPTIPELEELLSDLNGKIQNSSGNIVYVKKAVLLYNGASELQSWLQDVPDDLFQNKNKYYVSLTMEQISGTPYDQVSRLMYEIRDGAPGQFVVNAHGSGFVSGHTLSVSVVIFKTLD